MKEWLKMKDRNVKIKSFFVFSSKISLWLYLHLPRYLNFNWNSYLELMLSVIYFIKGAYMLAK